MSFALIAGILLSVAVPLAPHGVNLAALDGWDIVVAADVPGGPGQAVPSEAYAAQEFQNLFEQAAGVKLPIATVAAWPSPLGTSPDRHIFIGPGAAMLSDAAGFRVEDFGDEDFRIIVRDNVIVIAGGRPRGTLYGVYTFLEDYVGVRFLTQDHTHVPRIGEWRVVGPVDRFYHPPLAFRWSFYAETNRYPAFAARNRTNTVPTEAQLGGKTGLQNINHTFVSLLPSKEFGKEHPEYYALVDGKRLADVSDDGVATQLCLTNPDVLRIVTQRVLENLRAHPDMKNVSVSQNDCSSYCRCPNCAAIDEREGTPMGSLLTFVNAVADEVAKEFPDVLVGTLAYSYSRKPPKTVTPRLNVQIQLCSGECCMMHPITDPACPMNPDFCRDMADWGRVCKNVSIWNYNTNFANYQLPCPNLRVIEPNIRYFVAHNAIGVFMQGVYNGQGGEFSDLRNYIMANLLWDPNRSGEALLDEFLRLHYKTAAPPIRRFIDLTHDNAARLGLHRGCSGQAVDFGIDATIAKAGIDAFEEALALADDDVVRTRVEKASICAYRAALEPFFNMTGDAMSDPEFAARMQPFLERFTVLCDKFGVEMLSEGGTFNAFKNKVAETRSAATMTGDSLVLVKTDPGKLCYDNLVEGTVAVRSTYESGQSKTVVYEAGRDYVVDYAAGTIARTADSRIPDFSTNMLYGQKGFDHSLFPGYGNGGFFVFVDYQTRSAVPGGTFPLCEKQDQSALLPKTAEKLRKGGPFKIVAYGDSITAGGDATSLHLQFQERWARYLSERFPQAQITVENGATGGDGTGQGLQRLHEKVLERAPDLVLIGFGMNDHNVGGPSPEQFTENLKTIVTQIREKTGAEAILFSAFPPNPDWKFGSHRMELYAAATRLAAEQIRCAYADVFSVWMKVLARKDISSLLGNNINHPNDFGHGLYFEALKSVEF